MKTNSHYWTSPTPTLRGEEVSTRQPLGPMASARPSTSPSPYVTLTPPVTRTSTAHDNRVAFLRQCQPHTHWSGVAAPTPSSSVAAGTAAEPRAHTPPYGDTSSSYARSSSSYSSSGMQTPYDTYSSSDDRTSYTVAVDATRSSEAVSSSSSPAEFDDRHRAPHTSTTPLTLPDNSAVVTEGGIVLAINSRARSHATAAVAAPHIDHTAIQQVAQAASSPTVAGTTVTRAPGIQVLTFTRSRPDASAATTFAAPAGTSSWCATGGTGTVVQRRSSALSAGAEPPLSGDRTAKISSQSARLTSGCLGRLPGAAVTVADRTAPALPTTNPPPVTVTDPSKRTDESTKGRVFGRPTTYSSSSGSSDSDDRFPESQRRHGDPLAYQPPRNGLRLDKAARLPLGRRDGCGESASACGCGCSCHTDGPRYTYGDTTPSGSSDAPDRSSHICTCCSACASATCEEGRCGHSCGDSVCCSRSHDDNDEDEGNDHGREHSACSSLSGFARVPYEARRRQAAVDPFATLGPAAPPLLRLVFPAQTAKHGTLAAPHSRPDQVSPPPPLTTASVAPHSAVEPRDTASEQTAARASPGTATRDALTQTAHTQTVEGTCVSTQTDAEAARDHHVNAADWEALVTAQTASLRTEWHTWSARMADEQAAREAAAAAAEEARATSPPQKTELIECGCDPHETADETALSFVRAAAANHSAQELHAVLAALYLETPTACDDAMYRRTELSAAEERERQATEQLAATTQEIASLLLEQLVSLEVAEARQRLVLLDLEDATRQGVLAPAFAHLMDASAHHARQLEEAKNWYTQQLLAEVLKQKLFCDVVSAETHARDALEREEHALRFTTIVPAFYAQHESLIGAAASQTNAHLSTRVASLESENAELMRRFTQLQQQDAERRVALAEALRKPTVTLLDRRHAGVIAGGPAGHERGPEDDEDLPVHRRFARAHQEALKAVRAQLRSV